MKKDKNLPASKEKKGEAGSNPENKFKKGSKGISLASFNNIVTGAVESVKAKSGRGLDNDGTNVDYNEGASVDYGEKK
ncbi:MAG: hypothetical protein WAU24_10765 [Chitinophagaceae bacterium]